jgi:hypothetical protein
MSLGVFHEINTLNNPTCSVICSTKLPFVNSFNYAT